MLTTEAEAKTKRCQEGYAASPGATREPMSDMVAHSEPIPPMTHYSVGPYGAAMTMATTASPMTAPIFCLGSACMAWRWRGWSNDPERNNFTPYNPTNKHPDFKRYGYCGKAGQV